MPWMLLRPPSADAAKAQPAEPPNEADAENVATPTGVDEDQAPAGDRPEPFDAWIMYGQAATSLFQAGVCRTLVADSGPPRSLYAGGFSTLNAVLLAMGGRRALERGWERLRSRRLLFNQALRELSFFRRFAAGGRGIGWLLARERMGPPAEVSPIVLHVGGGKVFLKSNATSVDAKQLRQLAEAAFYEAPADARIWRKAIEAALSEGAARIVLVGFDAEIAGSILEAAAASAENTGAQLACIAYRTDEQPRPIDFLLPGSGVPERLMADGDRAANDWLRDGRPSIGADGWDAKRGQ